MLSNQREKSQKDAVGIGGDSVKSLVFYAIRGAKVPDYDGKMPWNVRDPQ